ncbi:gp53-like domain-containing protein [Klebsiella pneumoniae]
MALTLLANNNAKSVLAAGISASATVITVGTGAGALFPVPVPGQSYFKLTITDAATKTISEIMHVTSVSGDVMTVIRGQEGTTPRVWSTNDIVANLMTAGTFTSCLQTANNLAEIKDAGSEAVDQTLSNLGFAKRIFGASDYIRIPDVEGGLIIQFGANAINQISGVIDFPIPFPNAALVFVPVKRSDAASRYVTYDNLTKTNVEVFGWIPSGTANVDNFNWIAIGY